MLCSVHVGHSCSERTTYDNFTQGEQPIHALRWHHLWESGLRRSGGGEGGRAPRKDRHTRPSTRISSYVPEAISARSCAKRRPRSSLQLLRQFKYLARRLGNKIFDAPVSNVSSTLRYAAKTCATKCKCVCRQFAGQFRIFGILSPDGPLQDGSRGASRCSTDPPLRDFFPGAR